MNGTQLADFEELLLCCHSNSSREHIAEAVKACKVGSNRAAVVMTWIALVYDFIDKLEQLESTGHADATLLLVKFRKNRQNNDMIGALGFEKAILNESLKKFEFISHQEYIDLCRLFIDRNRCAHPSMNSDSEVYQPSAELARLHISNAIRHFLRHPATQGKAALESTLIKINDNCFPTNTQHAVIFLQNGPMARPRKSLLSSVVIVIIKSILLEIMLYTKLEQHAAALNAIRTLHQQDYDEVLHEKLSNIIQSVPEDRRWSIAFLLDHVTDIFKHLKTPDILMVNNYVASMPSRDLAFAFLMISRVPGLNFSWKKRAKNLTANELKILISQDSYGLPKEIIDRCITVYGSADTFDIANAMAVDFILPSLPSFSKRQMARVLHTGKSNYQTSNSHRFTDIKAVVSKSGKIDPRAFNNLI